VIAVLILAVLTGSCVSPSVEPGASFDDFTTHLDEHVPVLMDRYDVPGVSMAVVRDGELVWSGAYGFADRKRERSMTVDAVFRVESISKSVTAWGVVRLVEQGKIDLDAPLEQYVGDWALPPESVGDMVTVRQLLSHSAGMLLGPVGAEVEYAPGNEMPTLRDYLIREARLVHEPGSRFLYSNVGFSLLELLVEEVTGREFAEYMDDEVLTPLGMRRSSFAWSEPIRASMPMGYERDGTPVPPHVYPVNAAGGLFAPVEDIARFVGAETTGSFTGQGVLERESIRMLHRPQVEIPGLYGVVAEAYGLGHFVEHLPDGRRAVWHGGQGHGWMTHFHAVPEAGEGIVILTNSERSWPFMAEVLSDWARWNGFESVKMGRIIDATIALRMLIGLVLLMSLWGAYRLVRELRSGRRRWAPFSGTAGGLRLLQGALGLGGMAGLAWSAAQPYLMVASIFPGLVNWASGALLILSVLLVTLASFPSVQERAATDI
jgi:CubicO group peptidase (beta-lactamase class C family)